MIILSDHFLYVLQMAPRLFSSAQAFILLLCSIAHFCTALADCHELVMHCSNLSLDAGADELFVMDEVNPAPTYTSSQLMLLMWSRMSLPRHTCQFPRQFFARLVRLMKSNIRWDRWAFVAMQAMMRIK